MATVSEILKNARIVNPITGRVVSQTKTIVKLLKEGVSIQIPDTVLFNTDSDRIIKASERTIRRIRKLRGREIFNNRIVPTFRAILDDIIEKVNGRKSILTYNNGRNSITLTPENIENFNRFEELEADDSFKQSITEIRNIGDYVITPVNEGRNRREGAFFEYLVPFEGLERYGIYSEYNKKNYDENCLIKAFQASGKLKEEEITRVKEFCKSGYIAKIALKEIAEKLEICIRLKYETKQKYVIYNKNSERVINLGLVNEHYFINEKTKFTSFFIENYNQIKEKANPTILVKLDKRDKTKCLNSYKIINLLVKQNYLTKIDRTKGDIIYNHKTDIISAPTVISKIDYKKFSLPKKNKCDGYSAAFFDFESSPFNKHTPFLVDLYINKKHITFEGFDCVKNFLNYIKNIKNTIFYAHNLRYDFGFLFNEKYFKTRNVIKTGNSFKMVVGFFGGKKIIMKDSYSVINMPLSKFGNAFGLPIEKDVMPYKIYTLKNIEKRLITLKGCLKVMEEKDHQKFKDNCIKLNFDKKVDIIEYAKYYCKKDTEVLSQGFNIFRNQIKELCDIDIIETVSLPQIVNQYLIKQKCFEGCYMYSGQIRQYFQKFVVGGRCMLANNEKQNIKEDIQDFDGVSLYPSAMVRIEGLEKGLPNVLVDKSLTFLNSCDNYYIRVNITKVGKKYRFPLISKINDSGIREFTNVCCDNVYLTKTGLEDLIKFQKIEFEVIDGLYFKEGFNTLIKPTIETLFNKRVMYKKEKNPIQNTIKLLMNSAYGKLLIKPIDEDYKFCYTEEEYNKVLNYNYNHIIGIINTENCKIFQIKKSINHSFNASNLGSSILSMSKRIMNEVLTLADDSIYYTDTDSIHILDKSLPKLIKDYKKLYNRELVGKNLGQFHVDFEDLNGKPVVSKHFIGLGKKSYLDILENEDSEKNYHIRMKGIPTKCIEKKGDILNQYEKLYKGEEIEYNLLDGCVGFDSSGFGRISSRQSFSRKIKF